MKRAFEEEINALRREKDSFFKADLDSPIPPEDRPAFRGLSYFPADPNYRVRATLARSPKPELVNVTTSTGTPQAYLKYGTLEFKIAGVNLRLVVYKSTDDPYSQSLFCPFSDLTSGVETYKSGRYLDLEESGENEHELDFNTAYNPYCAYNSQYTCPIPPRENKLSVRIMAGEKNYK